MAIGESRKEQGEFAPPATRRGEVFTGVWDCGVCCLLMPGRKRLARMLDSCEGLHGCFPGCLDGKYGSSGQAH